MQLLAWLTCDLGAGGLYSGFLPNLIRNSIISSSELVSYDVSKREYALLGVPDGPGLHLMSGLTAGLVATMLGNPMDVARPPAALLQ
jgi:solute carrier family 25 (mitochondrial dicarboxylate transporter), member 10